MNCGFEDCSLLGELVHNDNPDWETIFNQLYIERKPNTDAIADMAIENFVEMRETTANPKFFLMILFHDTQWLCFILRYPMQMQKD
jgi:kynurenine 3-monooxygenase